MMRRLTKLLIQGAYQNATLTPDLTRSLSEVAPSRYLHTAAYIAHCLLVAFSLWNGCPLPHGLSQIEQLKAALEAAEAKAAEAASTPAEDSSAPQLEAMAQTNAALQTEVHCCSSIPACLSVPGSKCLSELNMHTLH